MKSKAGTAILVIAAASVTLALGHWWGQSSTHRKLSVSSASTVASTAPTNEATAPLWTCSMHPQVIQHEPGLCPICHMQLTPLHSAENAGGSGVVVDSVVQQNMGVRTALVTRGPLVQSVRVVGYLEEPEPLHHDINLRVSGWIEKLYANIDGMAIEQGKPLFDLYSPELTIAIDELISARRQSTAAPADATAKSLLDTARRKLMQYGLPAEQVDGLAALDTAPRTVPILSPMTGHLTAKMVNEGAAAKAGDLLLRIASRHTMWIEAQVYEQQMPLISDGQPVRATIVSEPGKTFSGRVLFVHPHVDPSTRTALVRIEIPNQDLHLRQGMYATVDILADNYAEEIVIPREAVIDTGRTQVAFVALGEGRFEPREIKLGLPGQDSTVQVLSGVTAGERLVTSGQFLLDSESRLREAIAKFAAGNGDQTARTNPTPAPVVATAAPTPSEPPMHDHATTSPAADAATPIDVPHTDDIVKAYLVLAKAFGARQESSTQIDAAPLITIATTATTHATAEAKPLAKAVADAAAAMQGQELEAQRRAFLKLSDAVVTLVHRSKPSPQTIPHLYLLNCPMAFEEKGAHWLQDEKLISNPYYPIEMKRCGSIIETLTPN